MNSNLSSFELSKMDVLHFNIRSLPRICDNLQTYLATYNSCPSVVVLSGTWKNDSADKFKIQGIEVYSQVMEKTGAAVLLFLFVLV